MKKLVLGFAALGFSLTSFYASAGTECGQGQSQQSQQSSCSRSQSQSSCSQSQAACDAPSQQSQSSCSQSQSQSQSQSSCSQSQQTACDTPSQQSQSSCSQSQQTACDTPSQQSQSSRSQSQQTPCDEPVAPTCQQTWQQQSAPCQQAYSEPTCGSSDSIIEHTYHTRHFARKLSKKAHNLGKRGHHNHSAYRHLSGFAYDSLVNAAMSLETSAAALEKALYYNNPRSMILELMDRVTCDYNKVMEIDSTDSNRIEAVYVRLLAHVNSL